MPACVKKDCSADLAASYLAKAAKDTCESVPIYFPRSCWYTVVRTHEDTIDWHFFVLDAPHKIVHERLARCRQKVERTIEDNEEETENMFKSVHKRFGPLR